MIQPGLQRISRLLAETPLKWRAIHVAGTNGKGSICNYISGMLDVNNRFAKQRKTQHSFVRHGRFTSPHLVDRWDCITINGQPVQSSVFHEAENEVHGWDKRDAIGASEFELLTATAFEVFNREQVDIGVVEVGMGGRLDATNIIGQTFDRNVADAADFRPPPLVTAISKIGFDHQGFLGDTLTKIAREKAGIIKRGIPVVYDPSNVDEVVEVLRDVAKERGCPISPAVLASDDSKKGSLDYLPLHTQQNIALALFSTLTALSQFERKPIEGQHELSLTDEPSKEMLQAAISMAFPGRQQRISIERLTGRREEVLLDGAHNAQSALALASAVDSLRNEHDAQGPVTWVIAASSSKDAGEILSPLLKSGDTVFAVEFGAVDGMPWVKPMSSADLLEASRTVVMQSSDLFLKDCGKDILLALQAASEKAAGGPMVIAGSLYLVGDVLRLLRDS